MSLSSTMNSGNKAVSKTAHADDQPFAGAHYKGQEGGEIRTANLYHPPADPNVRPNLGVPSKSKDSFVQSDETTNINF